MQAHHLYKKEEEEIQLQPNIAVSLAEVNSSDRLLPKPIWVEDKSSRYLYLNK